MSLGAELRQQLRTLHPWLVERRRDIHRHPELAYEEVRTAALAAETCRELGLEVRTGVATTGVVARLRGARSGPTIALRADMDALPIQDTKSCGWASTVQGKMHACGHDAHTTMLLGAARLLSSHRQQLAGDVVFLFQPAEEGHGGALQMIEEGALEGVDFILGQHVGPMLRTGDIGVTLGPAMASADFFELRVTGKGGHGAFPHLAIDPIPVAAEMITAMQTIVSRTVDPVGCAVVSIGTINGGVRSNVIAPEVVLTGTVRAFDPEVRTAIPERVRRVAEGVAAAHGAQVALDYRFNYPALINPPRGVELLTKIGGAVLGAGHVVDLPKNMGAEDFAAYLERVPGCFYWLGVRRPDLAEIPHIHHPAFDLDENALDVGVLVFASTALHFLGVSLDELASASA